MANRVRVGCGTVIFKGGVVAHIDYDFLEQNNYISNNERKKFEAYIAQGAQPVFFKRTNQHVLIGAKDPASAVVYMSLALPYGRALHAIRA